MAQAAEAISAGDVVNTAVRREQRWGLMPFAALMGSVYPATYVRCVVVALLTSLQ